MRIKELLEQTVVPQPAGLGGKLPTTQPTEGPPDTSNTPTPNTTQPPLTAPTGNSTASPSSGSIPIVASTGAEKKDLDSLKSQITTLQTMIAKQMQMQQQQSTKPGQS